jgi:CBS domain-containing protein
MTPIRDVMSGPVITVEPTVSARDAAKVMRDQDTGDVVITRDGHLEGILTDRDLVVRLVTEDLDPEVEVTEVCTSEPITIDADQPLKAAATPMSQYSIRRLPLSEISSAAPNW